MPSGKAQSCSEAPARIGRSELIVIQVVAIRLKVNELKHLQNYFGTVLM